MHQGEPVLPDPFAPFYHLLPTSFLDINYHNNLPLKR